MKSFLYAEAGEGSGGGTGGGGTPPSGATPPAAPASLLAGAGAGSDGGPTPPGGGGQPPGGQPPAGPWFSGLYDQSGNINAKAFDALPDHLKGHKDTFAKYKTVDALLGAMGNLAQLAGKKGLQPLPANSPPEVVAERQALMRQLNNVPEKPDGYGIKKPDATPDDQWNGEYVNGVLGVLHKHNASPELVKELVAMDQKFATDIQAGAEAATTQAMAKEHEALTKEFGVGLPKKLDLAARAARTLGLDPETDAMFRTASGVKAMLRVAEMVSEDKLVSGDTSQDFGASDLSKARSVIHDQTNPLYKAYHNPEDPGHQAALQQVQAWYKSHSAASKRKQAA